MSEHESTYEFLTGRQLVELAARLRDVRDAAAAARRAIGRVDLADAADRRVAHLLAWDEAADQARRRRSSTSPSC